MKLAVIKLTPYEAGHLLSLIAVNERDGWYYSPKEQYWARSKRIENKLLQAVARKPKGTL